MIKHLVLGFLILVTAGVVAQDLTATQSIPSAAAPGSSFMVEININRGSINGFMKFFQELPAGFTATEVDSKGGSFSFADNGAKVVWIAPPNETTYTITYKVNVPADASGTKTLNAKFSYINNNERKIFEFEPKNITIGGDAGASVSTSTPAVKASQTSTQPAKNIAPPDKTGTTATIEKSTTPAETTTPVVAQKKEVPSVTPAATNTTSASAKTYRVQIGAFSAKPKLGEVADITTIVLPNGITKYFSGNFTTLEEANKRKEEVTKKGFPGAFVVAFENGKIAK